MTQVIEQGNILSTAQYPQILDDTLNFVAPAHDEAQARAHREGLDMAFAQSEHADLLAHLSFITLRHHLNGDFFVAQIGLQ